MSQMELVLVDMDEFKEKKLSAEQERVTRE